MVSQPTSKSAQPAQPASQHAPQSGNPVRQTSAPLADGPAVTGPPPPPLPAFEKVLNLRDLGGLPTTDGRRVRHGLLYRSAHLGHATPADVEALTGLGLRLVIDFRNSEDLLLDGQDVVLEGTRHVQLPLSDPADGVEFWRIVRTGGVEQLRAHLADGVGERRMVEGYRKYVLERTAEHRRFLRLLIGEAVDGGEADGGAPDGGAADGRPGLPALWHCSVGKDRAGWSTAIVLLALGVEREALEEDYLATNAAYRDVQYRAEDGLGDPEIRALLAPLFEARPAYLAAAFSAAEDRWGSLESYLTEGLALDPASRERLRDALLEERPAG